MTAITGDIVLTGDAQVTAITGTVARAANVFSTTAEAAIIAGNEHPFAEATLSCSFTIAPTAGSVVHLFRRDMNIDGANDAQVPSATYGHEYVGSFLVNSVVTQQYSTIPVIPLRLGDQEFYIQNATNQSLDSDYVMKIKPLTSRAKS